jgi:hypothetical protein
MLLLERQPHKSYRLFIFLKLITGLKLLQRHISPNWCIVKEIVNKKNVSLGKATPGKLLILWYFEN